MQRQRHQFLSDPAFSHDQHGGRPAGEAGDGLAQLGHRRAVADEGVVAALVDARGVDAVTGATVPEHLTRMRELMPRATFLLPGVGAQGGRIETLGPAFRPGPAGGLVTVSRGIARAGEERGGQPGPAARDAAEGLRDAIWSLSDRA